MFTLWAYSSGHVATETHTVCKHTAQVPHSALQFDGKLRHAHRDSSNQQEIIAAFSFYFVAVVGGGLQFGLLMLFGMLMFGNVNAVWKPNTAMVY